VRDIVFKWCGVIFIAGYHSPNKSAADFNSYLENLSPYVREYKDSPLIVIGDFNARHAHWDRKGTKPRGRVFDWWINEHNLHFITKKFVPTCINAHGQSVIDLALGNSACHRLNCQWRIGDLMPSSDHRIITIKWEDRMPRLTQRHVDQAFPRWSFKRLNLDIFRAVLFIENWNEPALTSSDSCVEFLTHVIEKASDISMPKNAGKSKAPVYWWNEELANLRKICIKNRRKLIRSRKKNDANASRIANREYKISLKNLKTSVKRAKSNCWKDLLNTIDTDPWGLPYKIVMRKLKMASHPICESLPRD